MFANKRSRYKNFVSEIDQFLHELNNLPGAKSNSRIELEEKYKRLNTLRDVPQAPNPEPLIWKDF